MLENGVSIKQVTTIAIADTRANKGMPAAIKNVVEHNEVPNKIP